MFSSITSQIKATIKESLQQTLQHAPTLQQNNNATPQIPAPWRAQFMPQYSCWLYVNNVTHQQSWVHPSQLQPQPHMSYQANAFPPPPQQQAQPNNFHHTALPSQPQQPQRGFASFGPSVCTPPQQQQQEKQQRGYVPFNPSAYPPPPPPLQQQQQSPNGLQPSPLPFQSQHVSPPHTRPFPPTQQQHQQFSFQGPPSNQHRQHSVPQATIPPKKSHTGRNIALGLGALVATVVGVDMLSDDGDIGDSFPSGDAASSADYGTVGGDYSTTDYSSALALDQQATALNSAQNAVVLQGGASVVNASLPADSSYSYEYV